MKLKNYFQDSYVRYDSSKPSIKEISDYLNHELSFNKKYQKKDYEKKASFPADGHGILIGGKLYRLSLEAAE